MIVTMQKRVNDSTGWSIHATELSKYFNIIICVNKPLYYFRIKFTLLWCVIYFIINYWVMYINVLIS